MSLSIGIVGLPNVGKSTLFNALTQTKSADSANFPFCTIEPNKGIVNVPDYRLEVLKNICNAQKVIPANVEFIDIAGLVEGASKGEGLGNQFLANIRETDAICQVVRVFEDSDVIHVGGGIDPRRDIDIIHSELLIKDMESLEKRIKSVGKRAETTNDKPLQKHVAVVSKVLNEVEKGILVNLIDLTPEEKAEIKELNLLTNKEFIYIANISEDLIGEDLHDRLGLSKSEVVIPICAKVEQELSELSLEDRQMFLDDLGITESALDIMIKAAFESLKLMSYITAGEKEVRAWTIHKNFTAPQAAGVIHTDFEKGFIKADVVSYEDFVEHKGWVKSRDNGKVRQEGKEYIVQDGDIMLFKFSS